MKKQRRKICIVTTSRAEYGLQTDLMQEIQNDKALKLQLLVSGSHLDSRFGLTYKIIEQDGFLIDVKVKLLLLSDKAQGSIKAMTAALEGGMAAFLKLRPDLVMTLGDRYEMFMFGLAAYMLKIPVAHLHGGELTAGVHDEAFRHMLTKIAVFHFPAAETYRRRIIQLGEDPKRVFNYGAPGLDAMHKAKLLDEKALAKALNFDLSGQVALVTFHPVTLSDISIEKQIKIILTALGETNLKVIFTGANADPGGQRINRAIIQFCKKNPKKYCFFNNLGNALYWSCSKNVDLMIGNSSSGLLEAPSFGLPAVNVGDREKGRVRSTNVIDVKLSVTAIKKGIEKALKPGFRKRLKNIKNPYEGSQPGQASRLIKEQIKHLALGPNVLGKKFYDLNFKIN